MSLLFEIPHSKRKNLQIFRYRSRVSPSNRRKIIWKMRTRGPFMRSTRFPPFFYFFSHSPLLEHRKTIRRCFPLVTAFLIISTVFSVEWFVRTLRLVLAKKKKKKKITSFSPRILGETGVAVCAVFFGNRVLVRNIFTYSMFGKECLKRIKCIDRYLQLPTYTTYFFFIFFGIQ